MGESRGSGGEVQSLEGQTESFDVLAGELQQESVSRRVHVEPSEIVAQLGPLHVGPRQLDERVVQRLHDDHVHTHQDGETRPPVVDQVLHVSQPPRDGDGLAALLVFGEHGEVFLAQPVRVRCRRTVVQQLLAEPPVERVRQERSQPERHVLEVLGVLVLEVVEPGGGVDDHQFELVRPAAGLAVLDQVVAQQGAHGQSDDADGSTVVAVPGVVVDRPDDVLLAEPAVGRQFDDQQVTAVVVDQVRDVVARSHLRGADTVDVDGQDVGLHVGDCGAVCERERLHQPVSLVVGGALNEYNTPIRHICQYPHPYSYRT